MIERKKKICKSCGKERYIFGLRMCSACYNASKRLGKQLSRPRGGRAPFTQQRISPRSDKRLRQEAEYKIICKEIDAGARETGNLECFFCGDMVERADHHHLDGRDGDQLTKKEWIVRAHRRCHMAYHDKPVEKLTWFIPYLGRLKQIDRTLFLKESWKLNK